MHRTTTTAATLLVTMAVTALAGCVAVQRPSAPGPPPAPAPASPRPDGAAGEQRVVQAPAREALELVGPSRAPSPKPSRATARPHPAPPAQPAPRAHPPRHAPGTPHLQPKPHRPAHHAAAPPPATKPPKAQDVCALGRKYGGWKPGSPEAVICKGTYGH
ncbi:hypothetical protein ACFVTC_00265 [Streptomyces sp. NPDC057950]|uniref:hypothetical protein n=1 Tax=Streptomyces sp. NPDC057950 TaxID=3346288 RepID=UPI0036E18D9A